MKIKDSTLVMLGQGKCARSDKITALRPIRKDGDREYLRGPGERTVVYIEHGNGLEMVVGKTEKSIIRDMCQPVKVISSDVTPYMSLLQEVKEELRQALSAPGIADVVQSVGGWDMSDTVRRIDGLLGKDIEPDEPEQAEMDELV